MSEGCIILAGFMGAGKTTVGNVLARKLSLPFIDTDSYIEEMAEMKIAAIFEQYGEEYFRNLETETVRRLLEQRERWVVSCGGGMVLREENRKLLRQLGTVVYLKVKPETVVQRLRGDSTRPLLQGDDAEKKIRVLLASREDRYEMAADISVCVDDMLPDEICVKILSEIEKST